MYIVGTRECYCNGTWGPEPCQVTIGQVKKLVCAMSQFLQPFVKISEGSVEQGLKLLLELPPSSINNSQRLDVLTSAFKVISKLHDSEQLNEVLAEVNRISNNQ